jgi:hypothetical protein
LRGDRTRLFHGGRAILGERELLLLNQLTGMQRQQLIGGL